MAILWCKQTTSARYEVRKAGNSIRLYTDGIFHSQWNASRPFAGHLWDFLFLPVCFVASFPKVPRALVLGVGGGTVINLLQRYTDAKDIMAVDLDEQHFYVAKKFFKVTDGNANVDFSCEYAQNFVSGSKHKYDYVLEDLFMSESAGSANAVRAVEADAFWFRELDKKLKTTGVLVMNFESSSQLRKVLRKREISATSFTSVIEITMPRYENAVAVLAKKPLDMATFYKNIEALGKTLPANYFEGVSFKKHL